MIDLSRVSEIKNVLNNKIIDTIQDELGNIIYSSWKTLDLSGIPPLKLYKNSGRNLIDYKIYGNSLQGGLPLAYTKLSYIESVGQTSSSTYGRQYINTNYVPSVSGYKVQIGVYSSSTNTNTGCFIYGSYDSTDGYKPSLYVYAQTRKLGVYYNQSSNKNTNITYDTDTDYDITVTTSGATVTYDINGSTGTITTAYNPVDNNVPITLFTSYVGNTYILKNRVKYCKIYDENDKLVRDLIPCFKKSDNTVGMYDLANEVFYAQQGAGTFNMGTKTVPTPETPLEVQSVGTKTKNMLDVPQSYTFTSYPNLINNVDQFELNVSYKLIWTSTVKGSTNELAINLGGDVGWVRTLSASGGSKTFTYTTLPTAIYLYANGANASQSAGITSTINGMMIIKASESTDYEPYGYKIPVTATGGTPSTTKTSTIYLDKPLMKLGDATDYIDYKNNKIVRNIGIMKPTSSYTISTVTRNTNTILVSSIGVLTGGQYGTYNKISNVLETSSETSEDYEHIRGASISATKTWLNIWINKSRLSGYTDSSTDNEVKTMVRTWLVNNNFTVYYELENATETAITATPIQTIKGDCVISVGTTIQPSNMIIQYKGKVYTIIEENVISETEAQVDVKSNQVTSTQNESGGYTMTITGGSV